MYEEVVGRWKDTKYMLEVSLYENEESREFFSPYTQSHCVSWVA